MSLPYSNQEVAHYYDHNTGGFLRFGQGGAAGVLHRAVWGPGVSTRAEAFDYVHRRLLDELRGIGRTEPSVLDLGCGVGASLISLAERLPLDGLGLSNSAVQVAEARRRLAGSAARGRVCIRQGDFCSDPIGGVFDLAYAIESFVHASSAEAFFAAAGKALRSGGRLVLCDDFLAEPTAAAVPWIEAFRDGWRVSSLLSPGEARELGRRSGLELCCEEDLTPHLELNRPRDHVIRLAVACLEPLRRRTRSRYLRSPGWLKLVGGNALRHSLKHGWIHYRYLVFARG